MWIYIIVKYTHISSPWCAHDRLRQGGPYPGWWWLRAALRIKTTRRIGAYCVLIYNKDIWIHGYIGLGLTRYLYIHVSGLTHQGTDICRYLYIRVNPRYARGGRSRQGESDSVPWGYTLKMSLTQNDWIYLNIYILVEYTRISSPWCAHGRLRQGGSCAGSWWFRATLSIKTTRSMGEYSAYIYNKNIWICI